MTKTHLEVQLLQHLGRLNAWAVSSTFEGNCYGIMYENVLSSQETLALFIKEVMPIIETIDDYENILCSAESTENIFFCSENPLGHFLTNHPEYVFKGRDSSVLLDASQRTSLDFSVYNNAEYAFATIEKQGGAHLYIPSFKTGENFIYSIVDTVYDNYYDAMDISALLTYATDFSLDIDRLTGDMSAEIILPLRDLEYPNSIMGIDGTNDAVLRFPLALAENEKRTLREIIEKQIGEPIKLSDLDEKLTQNYINEQIVKHLKNAGVDSFRNEIIYENVASSEENIALFLSEVMPVFAEKFNLRNFDNEAEEKWFRIFRDGDSIFNCSQNPLGHFVINHPEFIFKGMDTSILLDPSQREEIDFTILFKEDEHFAFESIEARGDEILYIPSFQTESLFGVGDWFNVVFENVFINLEDVIQFSLIDWRTDFSLSINRLTGEINAEIIFPLVDLKDDISIMKISEDKEAHLRFPLALTENEQKCLWIMVEEQLGEPILVSEKDLKRNSCLREKETKNTAYRVSGQPSKTQSLTKPSQKEDKSSDR